MQQSELLLVLILFYQLHIERCLKWPDLRANIYSLGFYSFFLIIKDHDL